MNTYILLIVPFLIYFGIILLVLRLVGPWVFRINHIINIQKDILQELKKMNLKEGK